MESEVENKMLAHYPHSYHKPVKSGNATNSVCRNLLLQPVRYASYLLWTLEARCRCRRARLRARSRGTACRYARARRLQATGAAVMADDLDELLDEVELRFCQDRPAPSREGAGMEVKISAPSVSSKEISREQDDLSDLIDDIFHDDPSLSDPSRDHFRYIELRTSSKENYLEYFVFRCCPVYLGGSSAPLGLGTNTSPRTCDQLRCTTCDFRVIALDDYEWNKSCDYFFFRNNMPNLNKLKAKTLSRKGTRAYACQCSWRSIQELTDLREEQELRWVCGKH
ncbi:hypothetical protein chiPu_0004124 [Chiloscyllium punctatum]|uniref:Cilia- and flagella-associated protein 418 n=1 Tax=Chiloscyllium punctatum TaxID=137246 RepID=A0A401S5N4_CHIPU|nr:hypothetical protein [Chiloscyllium punctatum]